MRGKKEMVMKMVVVVLSLGVVVGWVSRSNDGVGIWVGGLGWLGIGRVFVAEGIGMVAWRNVESRMELRNA